MKKNKIFLLTFFLSSFLVQAQNTLTEGFESWPPPGWEIFTEGPSTRTWRQDFEGIFHSGSHSADSNISNNVMDNWLVSSAVEITNSSYVLKYWELSADTEFYDMSTVHISTGSNDPSSGNFVQVYEANILNTATWEERSIDLSAFSGQTIYVAFRHQGTYHKWYIDDVSVNPSSYSDGELTQFTNPLGVSENPIVAPVIVQLKNTGTTVINDFSIEWEVNTIPQSTYNGTALNLQPGQSTNVTIGSYNFNNEGFYNIVATLNLTDDFDPSNNQAENTFDISSFKDGALISITPEGMIPNVGSLDVKATISNVGENIIDVVEIEWSVDGFVQTPYTSSALNLQPGENTTVIIGQYGFNDGLQIISATLNVLGDINESNDVYESTVAYNTFYESFEGAVFPPEDWSINFGTRDGINFDTPVEGEYYYVSNTDDNYFGVVTDTIYTPLLDIENGDRFRFYLKTTPFYPVNVSLVWKDGSTGEVNFIQNIANTAGLNTWELRNVDISSAAGTNYIGLVITSSGTGECKFDLFTSDASLHLYNNDLKILNGDLYFLAKQNVNESFECKIRNSGSSSVLGNAYTVKLMEAPNTEIASVSGVDLQPWEDTTITLNHTFTDIGLKRLYFKIDYLADENVNNNIFRESNVSVVPNTIEINTIGTPDLVNASIPFSPNGNTNSLGEDDLSQTLYYDNEFNSAGYVYGVVYKYDNLLQADKVVHYPLKVWISQTNVDNLDNGWVPNSELTLVYDGVIEILPGLNRDLYIPFDQPVLLNGLENLVVQVYQYDPEWPPSIFRFFVKYLDSGPNRTIAVNDVYDLDPINPPNFYYSDPSYAFTRFVVDPVLSNTLLTGVVYDNTTNNPLQNATVAVEGSTLSALTDVNGNYTLPQLPHGNYNITASKVGFQDSTLNVDLNVSNQTQDFYLDPLNEVEVVGTIFGSNDVATPLENVSLSLYQDGILFDTVSTDSNGNFLFPLVYGGSDYELKIFLYGYYEMTITISPIDIILELGDIILDEEFISAFDVEFNSDNEPIVSWNTPKLSSKVKLQQDFGEVSNSFTNEPLEDVWLGNYFLINEITTLTSVEIQTDVYPNALDYVTIDIFDIASSMILASSEPFLIEQDSLQTIEIPNIVVYDNIAVMVHWQNNQASTNSLAVDYSDINIPNTALIKYTGQPFTLLTDLFGDGTPNMAFHVRVNTLDNGNPMTNSEIVKYNVYRGLASEFPNISNWDLLTTTPTSDLSLVDLNTDNIDSNQTYRYAVEALYTEGSSEVTFSNSFLGSTLSISDLASLESKVLLYPNPAEDYITIELAPELILGETMEIYDILGKQVMVVDSPLFNDKKTINIDFLETGLYFLKMNINGKELNKKLIKK